MNGAPIGVTVGGVSAGGDNAARHSVTIAQIKREVCKSFHVSEEQLTSASRTPGRVKARMAACYLCYVITDRSSVIIGMHLGYADHTTVLHGVWRISELRKADEGLNERINKIIAMFGTAPGRKRWQRN